MVFLSGLLVAGVVVAPGALTAVEKVPPLLSPGGPIAGAGGASEESLSRIEGSKVSGVTRCLYDLNLGLPLAGRLAKVAVTEGSAVKDGTLLAHLDIVAEQLDVERRQLQWKNKAELTASEARKATTEKQLAAAREIFAASRGISREEVENRELAHSVALAEHERLVNAEKMEGLDYRIARENLDRRSLRSPTRGIVTKVFKQTGESVQANEPVVRVCDLTRVLFVANVPVSLVGGLAEGDAVELEVGEGDKPKSVRGRVLFVSPVVDAASGLREVKIELSDSGQEVRPGLPARIDLGKPGGGRML
ncbi:MAG: efflux RND transporter periplasmic adaptor subunit [Magnetococcales bacterium]|nr:efflux RND transporter periplasmic adaptor subunit [Magnetococcales bacterium]